MTDAYFCPACGSPSLEISVLAGGVSSCKACPWTGSKDELVAVPTGIDGLAQEDLIHRFVAQLSSTFAKSSAKEVALVLLRWGFIDQENLQEDLKSYIKAMAIASTKAVLETRQQLERARINKLRSTNAS